LAALVTWFTNADVALGTIRVEVAARGLDAPPVRCWPHHLDLDTLVTVAPGRTTGVGFEPGDESYDEPYFYVSVYPAPDLAPLPPLPPLTPSPPQAFPAPLAP